MADKESLEFSSDLEAKGAAAYLEALAKGLRDGRVLIESGDKSLNLAVGPDLSLEFEAKSSPEKGKSSIEIKLTWRAEEPVEEAPPSLFIASGVGSAVRSDDSHPI